MNKIVWFKGEKISLGKRGKNVRRHIGESEASKEFHPHLSHLVTLANKLCIYYYLASAAVVAQIRGSGWYRDSISIDTYDRGWSVDMYSWTKFGVPRGVAHLHLTTRGSFLRLASGHLTMLFLLCLPSNTLLEAEILKHGPSIPPFPEKLYSVSCTYNRA
jgi:hypothetical protein